MFCLTLTLVVFEYLGTEYKVLSTRSLTLTLVVFELFLYVYL